MLYEYGFITGFLSEVINYIFIIFQIVYYFDLVHIAYNLNYHSPGKKQLRIYGLRFEKICIGFFSKVGNYILIHDQIVNYFYLVHIIYNLNAHNPVKNN